MRAAPNKLLLVGLELKLVIAVCLLYHLLIYFDGLYFKQKGSDYRAARSGFIASISMVKCSRKPLKVCMVISFVVTKQNTFIYETLHIYQLTNFVDHLMLSADQDQSFPSPLPPPPPPPPPPLKNEIQYSELR